MNVRVKVGFGVGVQMGIMKTKNNRNSWKGVNKKTKETLKLIACIAWE
jgi:hypothetical protein